MPSSSPTLYSATITCVSCQARFMLPYQEDPPTREDHSRLAQLARENCWTPMRGGAWVCSELRYVHGTFMCRRAALGYAQIRAAAIRHRKRGGKPLMPINPAYFSRVTIINSEEAPPQ